MPLLIALLLSVTLSPPFGEASARLIGFTPTEITFEITVEVFDPAVVVLMRGEDIARNEVPPLALLSRGDGLWGAVVVLPARPDLRIVFESIPERGGSTLSDAASLAELGIDPDLLSIGDRPQPSEPTTSRPGLAWPVVAIAAALGALILLAIWSRTSGGSGDDNDDEAADEHAGYDGLAVDGG